MTSLILPISNFEELMSLHFGLRKFGLCSLSEMKVSFCSKTWVLLFNIFPAKALASWFMLSIVEMCNFNN